MQTTLPQPGYQQVWPWRIRSRYLRSLYKMKVDDSGRLDKRRARQQRARGAGCTWGCCCSGCPSSCTRPPVEASMPLSPWPLRPADGHGGDAAICCPVTSQTPLSYWTGRFGGGFSLVGSPVRQAKALTSVACPCTTTRTRTNVTRCCFRFHRENNIYDCSH